MAPFLSGFLPLGPPTAPIDPAEPETRSALSAPLAAWAGSETLRGSWVSARLASASAFGWLLLGFRLGFGLRISVGFWLRLDLA